MEQRSPQKQEIKFTAVDHRDGEQQHTRLNEVSTQERVEERKRVMHALVDAGMRRIEIGHLGNGVDVESTKGIIDDINERSEHDPRYQEVELQVLFGTQQPIMKEGLDALKGIDQNRVIVHVYDRLADGLRDLATEPYTAEESAQRIVDATRIAHNEGFRNFSISGEGATAATVEEAVDYYAHAASQIAEMPGVQSINANLANTFGVLGVTEWNQEGLQIFNNELKARVPGITTSIHTHNDHNRAAEYSVAAIRAGFDRVESTMVGTGERIGNAPTVDVVFQLLSDAREQIDQHKRGRTVRGVGITAVDWATRSIEPSVTEGIPHMYKSAHTIAEVYGAEDEFMRTIIGNPDVATSGSGPHDSAAEKAMKDPIRHRLWGDGNYAASTLIHFAMGNPSAEKIMRGDPDMMEKIVVGGHAGGGSTARIKGRVEGVSVETAPEHVREAALMMAEDEVVAIIRKVSNE